MHGEYAATCGLNLQVAVRGIVEEVGHRLTPPVACLSALCATAAAAAASTGAFVACRRQPVRTAACALDGILCVNTGTLP